MAKSIDNNDSYINSRDVINYLEELESDFEDYKADNEEEDGYDECAFDDWDELVALRKLQDECEGYSDWDSGATLVRYDCFQDYMEGFAHDCYGPIPDWLENYVDWESFASDAKQDYTSVYFDGIEYLFR